MVLNSQQTSLKGSTMSRYLRQLPETIQLDLILKWQMDVFTPMGIKSGWLRAVNNSE